MSTYVEGFDEWTRVRCKTHPDIKYWTLDEETAAELAWCEAWDNAEKWAEIEHGRLLALLKTKDALIARLEHENSFLESVNVQLSQGQLGARK